MTIIRIVAELNIDDEQRPEYDESLHDAVSILSDQVLQAIEESDALNCEAFGDPIINTVYVEEERVTRTWERWQL